MPGKQSRPRYLLISPNRAGATWLADMLAAAGLGQVYSYYYPSKFTTRREYWSGVLAGRAVVPDTVREYVDFIWAWQTVIAEGVRARTDDLLCMEKDGFDAVFVGTR